MAQIARRIWSELRDEAILAAGGHTYTGYSTRMQYWITEAYYDLGAMYHQYELDEALDFTLDPGEAVQSLPANLFTVVGVAEIDTTTNQPRRFLIEDRPQTLFGKFRPSRSRAGSYARTSNELLFDCAADASRTYRLYYYRTPNAPDFAATSGQPNSTSEYAWLWDAHLLDYAVSRAKRRAWRPDLASFDAQTLAEWLEGQVQAQINDEPIITEPTKPAEGRPLGGRQG